MNQDLRTLGHPGSNPRSLPSGGPLIDIRTTRRVQLIDDGGRVIAYPEPHRTPVLPSGWAPLTREQQDAVLRACDAAPQCALLRLGSLWDIDAEYRVYRLTGQQWGGLWIASRYVATADQETGNTGANQQLLGLGIDAQHAIQLTVDFFNWDLETHGEQWRLAATSQPGTDSDPRR
jgi:hypothetical protein